MYDLPSDNPQEPGLPDEFHLLQPQILSQTFRPLAYPPERLFTASDLNLYYDVNHTGWYKRPDWFAAVGVPRFVRPGELRLSYVLWQEGVAPLVVVELLSPSTLEEDQGETRRDREPPSKWEVCERVLRVPYYALYSRENDSLRAFRLAGASYSEVSEPRLWIEELQIGLGLWQGEFGGQQRLWLRWYDAGNQWIPTTVEQEQRQTEQERQRTEEERQARRQAEQRAERLANYLRERGIDPDAI